MCAKVISPLQSFSASGKIADSLIFQKQNGRNIVRRYFRPRVANTREQANNRIFMAMVSQGLGALVPTLPYGQDLLSIVPSGQTWTTYIQQYATRRFGRGTSGLLAWDSDFNGHPNRVLINDFAIRIDFTGYEFDQGTDNLNTINPGATFFLLAELAFELKDRYGLFDRAVYNTSLNNWNLGHATAFKQDFTSRIPTT